MHTEGQKNSLINDHGTLQNHVRKQFRKSMARGSSRSSCMIFSSRPLGLFDSLSSPFTGRLASPVFRCSLVVVVIVHGLAAPRFHPANGCSRWQLGSCGAVRWWWRLSSYSSSPGRRGRRTVGGAESSPIILLSSLSRFRCRCWCAHTWNEFNIILVAKMRSTQRSTQQSTQPWEMRLDIQVHCM